MQELSPHQKDAIGKALHLREEINRFHQTWPTRNAVEQAMPLFTWGHLERQLSDLAATSINAGLALELVSAARKQARFKPPEMVLREILCIASAVMDETFPADGSDLGEAPMT